MRIWIVDEGDQYEGVYSSAYFFKLDDAVKHAKKSFNIREFEQRGETLFASTGRHEYVVVRPEEVR